jgi:hypothetical protein
MPRSRASGCASWRVRAASARTQAAQRPGVGRALRDGRAAPRRRASPPLSRRAPARPAHGPELAIPWHRSSSGEGGIRTLEAGFSPPNALAGRRLQPLGHFSGGAQDIGRSGGVREPAERPVVERAPAARLTGLGDRSPTAIDRASLWSSPCRTDARSPSRMRARTSDASSRTLSHQKRPRYHHQRRPPTRVTGTGCACCASAMRSNWASEYVAWCCAECSRYHVLWGRLASCSCAACSISFTRARWPRSRSRSSVTMRACASRTAAGSCRRKPKRWDARAPTSRSLRSPRRLSVSSASRSSRET